MCLLFSSLFLWNTDERFVKVILLFFGVFLCVDELQLVEFSVCAINCVVCSVSCFVNIFSLLKVGVLKLTILSSATI